MGSDQDPVVDAEIVGYEPPPVAPVGDYTASGVPTFDHVRDRIESRFATSVGAGEVAEAVPGVRAVEDEFEARRQAGLDKLEEIRRSLREDTGR